MFLTRSFTTNGVLIKEPLKNNTNNKAFNMEKVSRVYLNPMQLNLESYMMTDVLSSNS